MGRKKTGIKRKVLSISGTQEQIDALKALAERAHKNVSEFIFFIANIKK